MARLKIKAIRRAQSRQSIRTLLKFVPDSKAPLWRVGRGLTQRCQVQLASILAADHHRKRVFKSQASRRPRCCNGMRKAGGL